MPHTTHGKNCQKKAKTRGRFRRNIAREVYNGIGGSIRKHELTPILIFQRLMQRHRNELAERESRRSRL